MTALVIRGGHLIDPAAGVGQQAHGRAAAGGGRIAELYGVEPGRAHSVSIGLNGAKLETLLPSPVAISTPLPRSAASAPRICAS